MRAPATKRRRRTLLRLRGLLSERRTQLLARLQRRLARIRDHSARVYAAVANRDGRNRNRRAFAIGRMALDAAARGNIKLAWRVADVLREDSTLAPRDRARLAPAMLEVVVRNAPDRSAPAAEWAALRRLRGRVAFLIGDAVLREVERGEARLHNDALRLLDRHLARTGDRKLFGLPSPAVRSQDARPILDQTPSPDVPLSARM